MSALRVLLALGLAPLPLPAVSDCVAATGSAEVVKGRALAATELLDGEGNAVCLDQSGAALLVGALLEAEQAMSAAVLGDLQSVRLVLEAKGVRLVCVMVGEQQLSAAPPGWVEDLAGIPLLFDPERKMPELLETKLLPQTIVLDAQRRLAATISLHRASYLRELQRRVQEVLHPWTQVPLGALSAEQSNRFERLMSEGRRLLLAGQLAAATFKFEVASRIAPHSDRTKLWLALATRSEASLAEAAQRLDDDRAAGEQEWLARGHLGIATRARGHPRRAAKLLRTAVAGRLQRVVSPPAGQLHTPAPALEVTDFYGRLERPRFGTPRDVPTVVLFWNAGDAASVGALTALDRCARRAGRQNVEVVTVHVGTARTMLWDRLASLRSRLATFAWVPVWYDHTGWSRRGYGVTTLPTLVLVDDEGDVAARQSGDHAEALNGFLTLVHRLAERSARQNPTTQPADAVRRIPRDNWTTAVRLAEAGDLTGAAAALRRLREQMPQHKAAGTLLAELLLATDRLCEAEEVVSAGLLDLPDDAALLTLAGRCALARGRASQAAEMCRRAIAADPAPATGYAYLGSALTRLGQAPEACAALRRAVELDASEPENWFFLGDARMSAGDEASAAESFERSFRLLAANE